VAVRAEQEWLEFVADLLAAPLIGIPAERVAGQLARTFELVGTAYHHRSPKQVAVQRMWPVHEQFGGHRAELEHWGVHCAPAGHPLLRYYMATGRSDVLQVWDVPERFADRRVVEGWREIGGSWGSASQVALPLHQSRHSHRTFVVGRAELFTPGELRLARTLQRLLAGVDRQVGAVRGRAGPAVTDGTLLTPRELAVLALVADGLTAAAVARRLLIAERTVRKHLEGVYAKLGVHDRLSAVLRAQSAGLLAAPSAGAAPTVRAVRSDRTVSTAPRRRCASPRPRSRRWGRAARPVVRTGRSGPAAMESAHDRAGSGRGRCSAAPQQGSAAPEGTAAV
jgi:DNA-binding CsgD family transcriptional regulator